MKKIIIILGIGIIIITAFLTSSNGYLKYLLEKEKYFVLNDEYDLYSYTLNEGISINFVCDDSLDNEFTYNANDGTTLIITGCQTDSNGVYIQFEISNKSTFKGGSIVSLDTLDGTTELFNNLKIYLKINDAILQGQMISSGPWDRNQNYGLFFNYDSIDDVVLDTDFIIDFEGFILNDFSRK